MASSNDTANTGSTGDTNQANRSSTPSRIQSYLGTFIAGSSNSTSAASTENAQATDQAQSTSGSTRSSQQANGTDSTVVETSTTTRGNQQQQQRSHRTGNNRNNNQSTSKSKKSPGGKKKKAKNNGSSPKNTAATSDTRTNRPTINVNSDSVEEVATTTTSNIVQAEEHTTGEESKEADKATSPNNAPKKRRKSNNQEKRNRSASAQPSRAGRSASLASRETSADDETVVGNNNSFVIHTKADFQVTVLADAEDPVQRVREAIAMVWKQMLKKSRVHFLPFDSQSSLPALKSPADLPKETDKLQYYFPRVTPRFQGGRIFTKFHIKTDMSLEDILKGDMKTYWLQGKKAGIYEWSVQGIHWIADAGWLLYSHGSMDTKLLVRALQSRLPAHIRIGAKEKGIREETRIPYSEQIKAIHIQCDRKYVEELQEHLSELLSSTSETRPAGYRVRWIPEITAARNPDAVSNIGKARERQEGFLDNLINVRNESVRRLDYATRKGEVKLQTLRQMIMSIPTQSNSAVPLFVSIRQAWDNEYEHQFFFTKRNETEARLMIQNLLPYLRHLHGIEVEKYFSNSEIRKSKSVSVDSEGRIISNWEKAAKLILVEDEDLHFVSKKQLEAQAPSLRPDPTNLQAFAANTDAQTVSTLGTLGTLGTDKEANQKQDASLNFSSQLPRVIHNHGPTPSEDDMSTATFATKASVQSLQDSVQDIQNTLALLVSRLPPLPANDGGGPSQQRETDSSATGVGHKP